MIRWAVGVVSSNKKVLIGKLRDIEILIKRMDWTFPYATVKEGESPRISIKNHLTELGLKNVKVGKLITKFVPSENPKIEEYFYQIDSFPSKPQPNEKYLEFQYIKPTQVLKYFKTSISHDLMDYLRLLEKGKEEAFF